MLYFAVWANQVWSEHDKHMEPQAERNLFTESQI